MLGFLPTDLSYSLSVLMQENRDYFRIEVKFSEQGKTDQIDISINLLDHILKDQKVKDSSLMQTDSTSYSLRSFGGMPLTLQRMFHKINQHNINTTFGQEFQI